MIREATPSDFSEIHVIRVSVSENMLSDPNRITVKDYTEFLTVSGKGWVQESSGKITGFAIVDLRENNVWALFVHPDFEGKGFGKQLHDSMMNWYFSQINETFWLGTAPDTRDERFYTSKGWERAGMHGKEIKFEMENNSWKSKPEI